MTSKPSPTLRLELPTLTPTPTSTPASVLATLALGQYVVYALGNQPQYASLQVISTQGVVQGVLAPDIVFDADAAFSAALTSDNKRLAFCRSLDSYHTWDLFLAALTVGNTYSVTMQDKSVGCFHNWSPSGDALVAAGGPRILYLDDGRVVDLGIDKAFQEVSNHVVWSPDGRWIVYSAVEGNMSPDRKEGIYLIDTTCLSAPTTCKDIRRRIGVRGMAAWSPDSKYVAISPVGSNDFAIQIVQVPDGKIIRKLSGVENYIVEAMSWSPDGQWLAIDYLGKNATYLLKADGSQAKPTLLYETGETDSLFVGWLKIP